MENISSLKDRGEAADLWRNLGRGIDVKTRRITHKLHRKSIRILTNICMNLDDPINHQLTQYKQ